MKTARESLNQEREQAFDDMKAQVAGLAMDAAKKILLENADNISGADTCKYCDTCSNCDNCSTHNLFSFSCLTFSYTKCCKCLIRLIPSLLS